MSSYLQFAIFSMPCQIIAFDISGFFDSLDHALLKSRLKRILGVTELPTDWYHVFRSLTRYTHIPRLSLEQNELFGNRLKTSSPLPIATMREIKESGIQILRNSNPFGIPQGTPLSSIMANLYMIAFDLAMVQLCAQCRSFYRRYSDDILVICRPEHATLIEGEVTRLVQAERLSIQPSKTERTSFYPGMVGAAQYLGFELREDGSTIRASSLARQWRKMKRAVRRTHRAGLLAISTGKSDKVFTRKLRKRFASIGQVSRSFPSYGRRAADALKSKKIVSQVRRLERHLETMIRGFE